MPNFAKNILAVIIGMIVGMCVNMGIIMLSPYIFPLPEGVNVQDANSIAAHIHEYKPQHYIMPFLAHALGTLTGAYVAIRIAASHHFRIAMFFGIFFLIGGIMAVRMIPAPMWYNILDLVGAYIPMAWLATKLFKSENA